MTQLWIAAVGREWMSELDFVDFVSEMLGSLERAVEDDQSASCFSDL